MNYTDFLASKVATAPRSGFDVDTSTIHPSLFGHQRDAVRWALAGGRRALFLAFGLGKTRVQIEIARHIMALPPAEGGEAPGTGASGRVLIILPLGVRGEFIREAAALGVPLAYVRTDAELADLAPGTVAVTNYERCRDGHLSPEVLHALTAVLLDEASVLRSFGSKTYQTFGDLFERVPYRFVATATPSPNRYKELIHYADFLGVMDSGQALTRFFQRNSETAGDLTLMPHMEAEFWAWLASWGLFVTKPSDLGYSDAGYDLPPIDVQWHRLSVSHEGASADSWGQHQLFREAAIGVQQAAAEKRRTLSQRLHTAVELIEAEPEAHWLLWHHLEDERRAIERVLPEAVTAYGSQDLDEREAIIMGFADGAHRILATKPEIAGSGCNFQRHCSRAIFMGVDYSFNDLIQAVHRIHRFQQPHPVTVHIIYTDSEEPIVRRLREKWEQHERLTEQMTAIIRERGLADAARAEVLQRQMVTARHEVKGERFTAVHADCVQETQRMEDASVDLIVTSIPFSNQYEYTPTYNDFGHSVDDAHFFAQMDYLIPELLRVLKPGRLCAVHVKDRIRFGRVTGLGMPTVGRFSDKTADAFERHGFAFTGRITVVTDVVRENNQTYRLGWSEMCKDGTKMGVGMSEYVLLFRRLPSDLSRSYADEPVTHDKATYTRAQWQIDAHGMWRSSGDRMLRPEELASMDHERIGAWWRAFSAGHVYDYRAHVDLGRELEQRGHLPSSYMLFPPASHDPDVWTDVQRMRTLNSEQSRRAEEQHVCPLQFDIVERLVERFSNAGEVVMDPFGGLMTVPYVAVQMGRRGLGVELNPEYFRMGVGYLRAAEAKVTMPSLFDTLAAA